MKIASETPIAEILPSPSPGTVQQNNSENDASWANAEIIHLSVVPSRGLLGIVLANGLAALVQMSEKVCSERELARKKKRKSKTPPPA